MTLDVFIKGQLARVSINEAFAYGGVDNMAAVAHVIHNRVTSGWNAGEWMPTIEDNWSRCGTIVPPHSPNLRDAALRMFLARVDDIHGGREPDMVAEALYYADLNNIHREWFKHHILDHPDDHPRVAQVGPITFFR